MKFHVLTLFPDLFPGPLEASIMGRAREKGLWDLNIINIRTFATDKHGTVDDQAFGGGPGMVMRPDVIDAALEKHFSAPDLNCPRMIYLSPRGRPMNQKLAQELAKTSEIVLLCGRFEGVDQRVLDYWKFEEVSLGDFILSGGEIPAYALMDTVLRLRPGIIGEPTSIIEESFTTRLLEYPQYTRPREWKDCKVPEVLLSGNHQLIKTWRQAESERLTEHRRPDLWKQYLEDLNRNKG